MFTLHSTQLNYLHYTTKIKQGQQLGAIKNEITGNFLNKYNKLISITSFFYVILAIYS